MKSGRGGKGGNAGEKRKNTTKTNHALLKSTTFPNRSIIYMVVLLLLFLLFPDVFFTL